jgi:hypothetical protein
MAARIGHALYWLFCMAAGLWTILVVFAWEKMNLLQTLLSLSIIAVIWFIGWVLRYILTRHRRAILH